MNHDDGDKARQSDNHDDDNGEKGSEEDDGDVDQNVEGGAKFWTFTMVGDKGGHCNQEKS